VTAPIVDSITFNVRAFHYASRLKYSLACLCGFIRLLAADGHLNQVSWASKGPILTVVRGEMARGENLEFRNDTGTAVRVLKIESSCSCITQTSVPLLVGAYEHKAIELQIRSLGEPGLHTVQITAHIDGEGQITTEYKYVLIDAYSVKVERSEMNSLSEGDYIYRIEFNSNDPVGIFAVATTFGTVYEQRRLGPQTIAFKLRPPAPGKHDILPTPRIISISTEYTNEAQASFIIPFRAL